MRKSKDEDEDEVVRCGYKVGGGAARDQGFEKEYAKGGKCVKRDVGGPMNNGQPQAQPQAQAQPQGVAPQLPQVQNQNQNQQNKIPYNVNYNLKKGGSAKSAVKKAMAPKASRPSAALIESITIMPKRGRKEPVCKEEGGEVEKKAIGGAAKVIQGTFGLKGNPPIKR
jgi:hypothetical protein